MNFAENLKQNNGSTSVCKTRGLRSFADSTLAVFWIRARVTEVLVNLININAA